MTIFLQLPQYISIGVSEVFTSVASLEFAYQVAPASAQSLIMSLRFCSGGISSFAGSAVIYFFSLGVKPQNNDRNLSIENVFFFLLLTRRTTPPVRQTPVPIIIATFTTFISSFSPVFKRFSLEFFFSAITNTKF